MTLLFPTDVDKLAPALVKACGALIEPGKGGKADIRGRTAYSYMTLPDLLGAVRAAFAANQLAALQTHTYSEGVVEVVTTVLHESGQLVVTPPLHIRCQADAQSIGSAATYGKRYQLAALVGLAGSDDDDGHRAQQTPPPPEPVYDDRPAPPARGFQQGSIGPGTASPQSVKYLWTLLKNLGTDEPGIRTWVANVLQIGPDWSTKDLSQRQVSVLIERLKAGPAQPGDTTLPADEDPADV